MALILITALITAVCTGIAGFAGILLAPILAPWLTYGLIGIAFLFACMGMLQFLVLEPQKDPAAQKHLLLMLTSSCLVAALAMAKDGAEIPTQAVWAFAAIGPVLVPMMYFCVWITRSKKNAEPS